MNLNNSSFSLRDYVSFVFPGSMLLLIYFYYDIESWEFLREQPVLLGFTFLIVGYFLGYASNSVGSKFYSKLYYKFVESPFKGLLVNCSNFGFDKVFAESVRSRISKYFGTESNSWEQETLLYICWRDIQCYEHQGLDYMFRLVSLTNLCASMVFPLSLFSIVAVVEKYYMFACIGVICLVVFHLSRCGLRDEFARGVYRIWYVLDVSREKKSA